MHRPDRAASTLSCPARSWAWASHAAACAALLAALACAPRASAQAADASPGGDPVVAAQLADIDRYGQRYGAAFEDELGRYQAAPRSLGEELRGSDWPHGRRYAACAIGRIVGRACRGVVQWWREHPDAGWDEVAAHFGVDPATLRRDIAGSYARWGRPLPDATAPR